MNSKKFNVYKSAVGFDIASGLLLIAGLVVGIILGFSSTIVVSSSAILNTVIATLIFMLVLFIYLAVRYEAYTGFTAILAVAHNVMLTTALVCIFRLPINDSFMMVIMAVCGLTAINNLVLFANKKEYHKTENREQLVNSMVGEKLKSLILINCVIFTAVMLMIFTFDKSIIMFVRPMLISIIATMYSSIFMVAPFWGYFVKEKKVRKQDNLVEKDYIK